MTTVQSEHFTYGEHGECESSLSSLENTPLSKRPKFICSEFELNSWVMNELDRFSILHKYTIDHFNGFDLTELEHNSTLMKEELLKFKLVINRIVRYLTMAEKKFVEIEKTMKTSDRIVLDTNELSYNKKILYRKEIDYDKAIYSNYYNQTDDNATDPEQDSCDDQQHYKTDNVFSKVDSNLEYFVNCGAYKGNFRVLDEYTRKERIVRNLHNRDKQSDCNRSKTKPSSIF